MSYKLNNDKLPPEWKWVTLNDISDSIQYGYTESSSTKKIGPKFLRITDIQDNRVDWDKVPFCKIEKGMAEKYLLRKGDLVFARTGATVGKSFLIKNEIQDAVFASYLIRVRMKQEAHVNFISYFFNSGNYWSQITEGQVGIGQPNVNGTKLGQLVLPLPPITEQLAIVSKIEELFSELDKGKQQLETALQQLKIYRQAVLKWAFEGKLTNKDVKEGQLPKGWNQVKLDEVGKLFCGQSSPVNEVNRIGKGTQYVTGPEQWNGKHIEKTKWTEKPKRIVPDGTIFITVKGAGVGKLFPGISCAIGRDVYAYLPLENLDFKYSFYALKHSIDLVISKAQGDIPGLAKNHILEHEIGICTLTEQVLVVEEIESRLSVCEKIEETIATSLKQAETLRQSILKKAFEGLLLI